MKTLGQILLAIGLTLVIGGFASFYAENVELNFINRIIESKTARMTWVIVNSLIALIGILFIRFSSIRSETKK